MSKIAVGDIVEIETTRGYAYAQCTHRTSDGDLIRVFEGVHKHASTHPEALVTGRVQFVTFFPLQHAVRAGIVRVVGRANPPPDANAFPLFRMAGLPDPLTHKVKEWWLFDGNKEWKVGALTPEQQKLPIRETINDTLLKERIVAGWRHEHEV
jgi:hypothetical protein